MNDTTKELLFGLFLAAVIGFLVVFVLGLDFEQPDYFIGVVR